MPRYIDTDGWNVIANEIFTGTPKQDGADNHAHVVELDRTRYIGCTFNANGASEGIKASNKTDLEFIDCTGDRGVEEVGDFIDCHNVTFLRFRFYGGEGSQDITAKGGCSNFEFIDCVGLMKIVLGNYTIYDGRGYSSFFQFWPSTPKTTRVNVGNCGEPKVESFWADRAIGECQTFKWYPFAVAAFFDVRRFIPEKGQNGQK
jgi:hypothetical protein